MSIIKKTLVAICGFVLVALSAQTSQAWHYGYPPYGAWAYGSGGAYYSHVGLHRHYGGHVLGWGGYANVGFTATTRVRYRSALRPFFGHPYWTVRYRSYNVYSPVVSYASCYMPSYSLPNCYSWPSYYAAPVYTAPIYTVPVYPISYGYPLCSQPLTTSAQALSLVVNASDTSQSSQLVALDYAQPTSASDGIPEHLMAAADAIFQAGGYRQAAAAYAQLNVRYGSSNQVFGRRFIAQIACGDLEQAAVIVASATAAGFQLNSHDLPGGDLHEIFGRDMRWIADTTEHLAALASSATNERDAMEVLSVWFRLQGDEQRSGLFMAMAQRLSGETTESQPTPLSRTEFVSLE